MSARGRFCDRALSSTFRILLPQQYPVLIGATVGSPLIHLRARRSAGAGIFQDEAAVQIEQGATAVAVKYGLPLVIAR